MTGPDDAFLGAVLAGGHSRRFGRDKALAEVDGTAMAARVAAALHGAGAAAVVAVGGDDRALGALGLEVWPDEHPGEGPLGGLVGALRRSTAAVTVVVACDLPWLTPASLAAVVAARHDAGADVAFASVAGRREPLVAAWRTGTALPVLAAAFSLGERAVHRAVAGLRVVEVTVEERSVRNVNHPDDLHR